MIKVLELLLVMFASGIATSFAESKFQYSLYETIAGFFKKV
jgi:hypothetical protein